MRTFLTALVLLALGTGVPAVGLFLLGAPSQQSSVREMILESGRWIREERPDPARPRSIIVSGHAEGRIALQSATVFRLAGLVALLAFLAFLAASPGRGWKIWGTALALAGSAAHFFAAFTVESSGGFYDFRELGLRVAWGGYVLTALIASGIAAARLTNRGRLAFALVPAGVVLVWLGLWSSR